ncbi:HTH domain protein [Salinivirga cyanobacteriivorans]|uniref:HTH domain protein n=1 Tax=Salinivirga cyanobacteriivorans TaxID=1307839 RepID=A0A0S2HZZ7_9BACT|nr:ATP-binding protein [Salinivirga cyanobacteriivorans]ALO15586.1 HTH domain protein [Salinivirga cyanobacteriivorans]
MHLPGVDRYQEYLSRFNPSHRYNNLTQKELLQKLQITEKGKISYAGLLLFGHNDFIQKEFPDFRIDLFEIPGKSYSEAKVRYTYRLSEQENLWEYYFTLFDRLKLKIDIPFKMNTEGFAIDDSPGIDAIREALVNLLMHTDYFSAAKPRIRIFTDRIEFSNPGGLPLSIEKLLEMDSSIPRNPILARTFRAVRLAENAGFGFDKMIDGWFTYNKTKPASFSDITTTITTFNLSETNVTENVTENRELQILEIMQMNPTITTTELAENLKVTRRTIARDIENLKNKDKLKRIGSDKAGYWEVLQ